MIEQPAYVDGLLAVLAAPDEVGKGEALRAITVPDELPPWQAPDVPLQPPRPAHWPAPGAPPRRRKSIADPHTRRRFLHAIHHIELSAVDLTILMCLRASDMPADFHRDQLQVAREEVSHAVMVRAYLEANDYPPGSESVHHRLWESARAATDIGAQLVIVPRFLEARGLDVSAELLPRLQAVDQQAGEIVERIYRDEIGHVCVGTHWHRQWCARHDLVPEQHFQQVCETYFGEHIPGPQALDEDGRRQAGFNDAELAFLRLGS